MDNKIEDFIQGHLNEQFLRSILAERGRIDVERMLNRVQAIQGELNTRLRQGVSFILTSLINYMYITLKTNFLNIFELFYRLKKIIHD